MEEVKPPTRRERLGEMLIARGALTEEQLNSSLKELGVMGNYRPRIGAFLCQRGYVTEEDVSRVVADQLGVDFVDLRNMAFDTALLERLPSGLVRNSELLPIHKDKEGTLVLAVSDPVKIPELDQVRSALDARKATVVIATRSSIRKAIESRRELPAATSGRVIVLDDNGDDEAPAVGMVDRIFKEGLLQRATDIHIEPADSSLVVRYRIDGVLRHAMSFPAGLKRSVLSRVKILSGMDISEHRRPQDGRGRIKINGKEVDFRTSTVPSLWGEKAVIRLLPATEELISLDGLGMSLDHSSTLTRYLSMSQGMIVFTGPTGSGKTTAMYAGLQTIDRSQKNVITLEDPIEYQLLGVTQMQVEAKSGLTFARGLRAILRQDPDVILVGEIRDEETARMAVQASMTGHLVLTTLHTNDSVSAPARLVEMGVEPFVVASALSLVVAQRLVRAVCEKCRRPVAMDKRTLDLLGGCLVEATNVEVFSGAGCEICGGTGYLGRVGVFEMFEFTPEAGEALVRNPRPASLLEIATRRGMITLRRDAAAKVLDGRTTFEEVVRTTVSTEVDRAPSSEDALLGEKGSTAPLPPPVFAQAGNWPLEVKIHDHPLLTAGN